MAKKIVIWGKPTPKICQWCFEEPAIEGSTVCQACIDAANKKEDDDFDLDKWLEGDKIMTAEFVKCSQCIYREDCENKENRDSCYCGDREDE